MTVINTHNPIFSFRWFHRYMRPSFGGRCVFCDWWTIENIQGPLRLQLFFNSLKEGGASMPCELRIRDDLSVHDVMNLAGSQPITVTPHVGNWTPARLVLPTLGVSILCVDHTIGLRDRNANPHLIIQNGAAHAICDHPDRLTTHARVTNQVNGGRYPVGMPLSEVHVNTIRELYPDAFIETHSEHLSAHAELTLQVLEIVTEMSPAYAWWRYVTSDGMVRHYRKQQLPRAWERFESNIFSLTNQVGGWLLHNRIAILMDVIEQSNLGENPEIYHLSGPDMVRYINTEMTALSKMYNRVRERLGLRQETIVINLVPFASFRFATRESQADACARLCDELSADIPNEDVLRTYLHEAPDVLASTEDQNHFSQHDMIATGERVVAQEQTFNWSMSTCAERFELLQRVA